MWTEFILHGLLIIIAAFYVAWALVAHPKAKELRSVPCDACRGSGRQVVDDELSVTCNNCWGAGAIILTDDE